MQTLRQINSALTDVTALVSRVQQFTKQFGSVLDTFHATQQKHRQKRALLLQDVVRTLTYTYYYVYAMRYRTNVWQALQGHRESEMNNTIQGRVWQHVLYEIRAHWVTIVHHWPAIPHFVGSTQFDKTQASKRQQQQQFTRLSVDEQRQWENDKTEIAFNCIDPKFLVAVPKVYIKDSIVDALAQYENTYVWDRLYNTFNQISKNSYIKSPSPPAAATISDESETDEDDDDDSDTDYDSASDDANINASTSIYSSTNSAYTTRTAFGFTVIRRMHQ